MVGLPWFEPRRDCHRLDVVGVGNGDVEADRDERLGPNPCLTMDDRLGVAVVGDALERDIAEPSRRLARGPREPLPVIIRVAVDLAVRLHGGAFAGHQDVMQPAPVNAPGRPQRLVHVPGKPFPVAVARRRVEPVRIDLRGQRGEIERLQPASSSGLLKDGSKYAVSVGRLWSDTHAVYFPSFSNIEMSLLTVPASIGDRHLGLFRERARLWNRTIRSDRFRGRTRRDRQGSRP